MPPQAVSRQNRVLRALLALKDLKALGAFKACKALLDPQAVLTHMPAS